MATITLDHVAVLNDRDRFFGGGDIHNDAATHHLRQSHLDLELVTEFVLLFCH